MQKQMADTNETRFKQSNGILTESLKRKFKIRKQAKILITEKFLEIWEKRTRVQQRRKRMGESMRRKKGENP